MNELDAWLVGRADALVAWVWRETGLSYSYQLAFVGYLATLADALSVFDQAAPLSMGLTAALAACFYAGMLLMRALVPDDTVRATRAGNVSHIQRVIFLTLLGAYTLLNVVRQHWFALADWWVCASFIYFLYAVPPKKRPPPKEREEAEILPLGATCA